MRETLKEVLINYGFKQTDTDTFVRWFGKTLRIEVYDLEDTENKGKTYTFVDLINVNMYEDNEIYSNTKNFTDLENFQKNIHDCMKMLTKLKHIFNKLNIKI